MCARKEEACVVCVALCKPPASLAACLLFLPAVLARIFGNYADVAHVTMPPHKSHALTLAQPHALIHGHPLLCLPSLALFLSCLPYCNSGSGMWLSLMMVIAGWHGQQKLEYNCSVEMVCYIILHISETDRHTHVQTDKGAETKICIFMS